MAVRIRNKNCVVALDNSEQEQARAVRVSSEHDWEIEVFNRTAKRYILAGTVKTWLPERLQRKLILTILKEFE